MFLLIAVRTVLPTLKSARDVCKEARPPRIIASSGNADDCIRYLRREVVPGGKLNGAGTVGDECKVVLPMSTRMPLHITPDWTYWLASTTDGHREQETR